MVYNHNVTGLSGIFLRDYAVFCFQGLRGGNGSVFATVEGGSGHSLHDGAGGWPHMGYEYTADGRSFASAVTVAWQLRDVPADMGGFACVPGSHHVST